MKDEKQSLFVEFKNKNQVTLAIGNQTYVIYTDFIKTFYRVSSVVAV